MTLKEKIDAVLRTAAENGVTVTEPDQAVDMSEPIMGRDARDVLNGLVWLGESGRFRIARCLSSYQLVKLAGYEWDEDNFTLADAINEEHKKVYEVPSDYSGSTQNWLLFFYDPKSTEVKANATQSP